MPQLITDENVEEILAGIEGEIKTAAEEFQGRATETRLVELMAYLLQLIVYLKNRSNP